MIIGCDIFHKTSKSSVVAFVATLNIKGTKYYSQTVFTKPGDDMVKQFKILTQKAIECFAKKNKGVKPKRIIYFRDGVGDS